MTGDWERQGRLSEAARRVEAVGQRFPQVYAGVAMQPDQDRLAVYRVPSAEFDDALRGELPDAPIQLVDAAHPARELAALRERVEGDIGYWRDQQIELNTFVARHDGSCVEVGTLQAEQARRLFPHRYGADAPIRIVEQPPVRLF